MLDEAQINRIVEADDALKLNVQDNYYYDLGRDDMAMRIRDIDGLYVLTIKKRAGDAHEEYEYELPDDNADNPLITELLKRLGVEQKPIYLGMLTTSRYTRELEFGEICLDFNKYNGIKDYEIEYELFDHLTNSNQELIDYLAKYHIEYKENKVSKFKRFLNSRGKQ